MRSGVLTTWVLPQGGHHVRCQRITFSKEASSLT